MPDYPRNSLHNKVLHHPGRSLQNSCLPSRFHISPIRQNCRLFFHQPESRFLPSKRHQVHLLHLLRRRYPGSSLPGSVQLPHNHLQGRPYLLNCYQSRLHPRRYSNMMSLQYKLFSRISLRYFLQRSAYFHWYHPRTDSRTVQTGHNPRRHLQDLPPSCLLPHYPRYWYSAQLPECLSDSSLPLHGRHDSPHGSGSSPHLRLLRPPYHC